MNDLRNILILVLAAGCAVLLLLRGCGSDAPAPAVKTRYVYDSTEVRVEVPVVKTVTRYVDRWKTDTLVRYVSRTDTVVKVDTLAIVQAWLEEEATHELFHRDSDLEATMFATVYQNEVTGFRLAYKILRPTEVHTTLGDRFQLHALGSVGGVTDFDATGRFDAGAGLLAEWPNGQGVGLKYGHTFGQAEPHRVEVLLSRRIVISRRRR
jgi:hypothetical protein